LVSTMILPVRKPNGSGRRPPESSAWFWLTSSRRPPGRRSQSPGHDGEASERDRADQRGGAVMYDDPRCCRAPGSMIVLGPAKPKVDAVLQVRFHAAKEVCPSRSLARGGVSRRQYPLAIRFR